MATKYFIFYNWSQAWPPPPPSCDLPIKVIPFVTEIGRANGPPVPIIKGTYCSPAKYVQGWAKELGPDSAPLISRQDSLINERSVGNVAWCRRDLGRSLNGALSWQSWHAWSWIIARYRFSSWDPPPCSIQSKWCLRLGMVWDSHAPTLPNVAKSRFTLYHFNFIPFQDLE